MRLDLSNNGPYATAEDKEIARELGITVRALRARRAKDDRPVDELPERDFYEGDSPDY